jgi:methionyl-tRNA formyltransferase
MKILLVAEEAAGIHALRALVRQGRDVVAVLTASEPSGPTVAAVAVEHGVTVLPSTKVMEPEFAGWIREQEIDLLVNIHSLYIIHAEVVCAPRIGSFNLHPGPLPHYAGLNAPSWAIYLGEERHAVTVHWMNGAVDTGPVAYSSSFEISQDDTGLSVSLECVKRGLPLVSRLVEVAATDPSSIPAKKQNPAGRRYFGREVPQGGNVRWGEPARRVVDFVRACDYGPFPSPWGTPTARLGRRPVGVTRASPTGEASSESPGTVARSEEDGVRVACADQWIRVTRISVDSKPVAPAAVLEPGMVLGDGD